MDDIKVSVVVPVYNTSKYLRECLDSILGQSMRAIEVVCVNDGSTDESLDILLEYEKYDERVKIITKENCGYGHTMNRGFDVAKGEYIGIVESDDYIRANMFEVLYEKAKSENVDFVKSNYYMFWGESEHQILEKVSLINESNLYGHTLEREEIKTLCRGNIANCTGIYKRDFIETYKIRHNETPGASYQDLGFFFQVIMNARNGYIVNENFYMYRQDNEASSINSKGKIFCNCDEYRYIQEMLKQDSTLLKDYNAVFQFFRFAGLRYTFMRIADEFRFDFLNRIKEDWEKDEEDGILDVSYFLDWEKDEFLMMYQNSEVYYTKKTSLAKNLINAIGDNRQVIIYGAGGKGLEVYNALKPYLSQFDFVRFAITKKDDVMQSKQGVRVECIDNMVLEHKDAIVIIAVTPKYEAEMKEKAIKLGFTNILTMEELA